MFLDYFALAMLVFVTVVIFYGVIAIHDIPYEIAKKRNHPHQDAIHYAGWVSLFTLHVLWPFLWVWATLWRDDRGWGFNQIQKEQEDLAEKVASLTATVAALQAQINAQSNNKEKQNMDLLLILTYTALCIGIFKLFKIPLNKWTVPTAVLGGVVLIGALILLMNYNHPHSNMASSAYVTTPIVPNVRGTVEEVAVKPNQPVKKGDLLFRLDDTLYRAKLNQAIAALQDAKQSVLGLEAAYKSAQASALMAKAEYDRSKKEYERYEKGAKSGAYSKGQVDNKLGVYLAAKASYEAAQAEELRQKLAFESEINGEQTKIAAARANLEQAQFNLDSTSVHAPTDGYVTQLTLRPGMIAVPMPLRPVMTFVHKEDTVYVAAFRQNSLLRLEPGYKADFIFKAIPGKTFAGEVIDVLPAIGEGQVQAQGTLMGTEFFARQGRAIVTLKITDDMSEYHLPQGTSTEVAVYSEHFEHVSVMRKVLIRMKSWQNYLFLDH